MRSSAGPVGGQHLDNVAKFVGQLLAATALVACWLPAWRAGATDPAVTLRAE